MRIFMYIVSDYNVRKAGNMGITFTVTDTFTNFIYIMC